MRGVRRHRDDDAETNSMIQEMILRSERADLIAAVSALLDDGVAAKAAELIDDDRLS